jgi:hypothetical protein
MVSGVLVGMCCGRVQLLGGGVLRGQGSWRVMGHREWRGKERAFWVVEGRCAKRRQD